jgi:hypothetical protein
MRAVVGTWRFHAEYLADADELLTLAWAAATAVNVLDEAGLLHPRALRIQHWLKLADASPERSDVSPMTIELSAPLNPVEISNLLRAHSTAAGNTAAFPHSIEVDGPGEIVGAGSSATSASGYIFGLHVLYDGVAATVSVDTYSDVWLPYSLKGEPQPELAAANAPRLAAALERLAEKLGTQVDPGEPTKYAEPVADGLSNHRDEDGAVIATTDW